MKLTKPVELCRIQTNLHIELNGYFNKILLYTICLSLKNISDPINRFSRVVYINQSRSIVSGFRKYL